MILFKTDYYVILCILNVLFMGKNAYLLFCRLSVLLTLFFKFSFELLEDHD